MLQRLPSAQSDRANKSEAMCRRAPQILLSFGRPGASWAASQMGV